MSPAKKQCPVCGCQNSDLDFFCQNCGMDISLVSAAAPAPAPQPPAPPAPPQPAPQPRVCPKCGQSSDLPLCSNCGFDLSTAASAANNAAQLFLLIGKEKFQCKHGDTLGREGTVAPSFFSAVGTVSRKHVSLSQRNGCWFLTVPPSVRNPTQLDGRELPRALEQPLTGEHSLKLSSQCEVRLQVVPPST